MFSSSLIETLRSFKKDELKKFEDFVCSPYFNKKTTVTKLFRIIKKYSPDFKSSSLDREKLWMDMFPGKAFNYGVMKNLIFDLQKLASLFMGYENIERNNYIHRLGLLDELSQKNLDQQFEKNLKAYSDLLKKQKFNDTFFYEMIKLEGLKYNHFITKKANRTSENEYLSNFRFYILLDFLRQYFIVNTNIALYRKDFSNVPLEHDKTEKSIDLLLKTALEYSSGSKEHEMFYKIISMYSNGYSMTVRGDKKCFQELNDLLKHNAVKLDMEETYNMYNLLTGYCVSRSMEGDSSYYEEEFGLYKTILDKGAYTFYKGGFMNRLTYYNIARTGIKLDKFDWTIKFLNEYKSKLHESSREQTYLFTYAFVEFGRKDHLKSLGLLSKLSHYEVRDKPREKMLYLMLYYELGYTEQFLSFLDSSRHFARNDKMLSDEYKNKFSSFLSFIYELSKAKFKLGNSTYDPGSLKKEILLSNTSMKDWLLSKLKIKD